MKQVIKDDLFFIPSTDDGTKKPIKKEKLIGLRVKNSRASLFNDNDDMSLKIFADKSVKDFQNIISDSNDNSIFDFKTNSPTSFKYYFNLIGN